jgi:hypothetical protein
MPPGNELLESNAFLFSSQLQWTAYAYLLVVGKEEEMRSLRVGVRLEILPSRSNALTVTKTTQPTQENAHREHNLYL